MKKCLCLLAALLGLTSTIYAQEVKFEEYDLSNGMHVILHQDNTAPVVTTSVMYHVGAKDENPERTGFAHFFEHLLFEGTKNIPKGEWFTIGVWRQTISRGVAGIDDPSQRGTSSILAIPSGWNTSDPRFHAFSVAPTMHIYLGP